MKKLGWLVASWVVILLAVPAALAQGGDGVREKPAKADNPAVKTANPDRAAKATAKLDAPKPRDGLKGEYAIMVNELKLSEAQQAQLTERIKARAATLAEWDAKNGKKLEELQAAAKAATGEEAKKLQQEARALQAERTKIETASTAEIMAVLTPEQKIEWEAFTLYRQLMRRYASLALTEAQTQKIRALCLASARETAARPAEPAVKPTERVRGEATAAGVKTAAPERPLAKLARKVEEEVLTPEQREKLAAAPPAGEKAVRPAAGGDQPARVKAQAAADKPVRVKAPVAPEAGK